MNDSNLANLYIGRATRALRDRELSPFFSLGSIRGQQHSARRESSENLMA